MLVKKGSTNWAPGQSCKDIRQSEATVGDGEYWINPSSSGKPIKVYCDMTTDKGESTIKQIPGKVIQVPSTRIRVFLNPQLFLSGYSFRPHVSGESGIRIHNFLNPLSRVEIFEYAMNPDLCGPLIRIFLFFFNPVA